MKLFSDDTGSISAASWFILVLFTALFVWAGLGKVLDMLTSYQAMYILANPSMPVSSDRMQVTTWMIAGWGAVLVLGIVLPLIFYAVVIAKRRIDSEV
jgi:hypothetical protein